jgi:hypothetical protein
MDLNVANVSTAWRCVFEHGKRDTDTTNDWPPGTLYRRPTLYIDPAGSYGTSNNCLAYSHSESGNTQKVVITPTIDIGKWFNMTTVVDNGKMTIYYNGTEKIVPSTTTATSNVTGTFNWFSTEQPWTWARKNYADVAHGSVQVANAYFWPSALTTDQISTVGTIPSSVISGVSTSAY